MKKISVISPVYNGKKYIINLIKSLSNQTFKDFEFLLIDDGSTDNTVKLAKSELEKTNIDYKIISQQNGGQSKARNLGIKNATGEWVVMIDSDDTIQSNYLNNLYSVTQKCDCDVVFCDLHRVDDENIFEELDDSFDYENLLGKEFFVKFIMHQVEIGPISLFIKREHLAKLKLFFNEKSRYSEEFIFICSLLYNSNKVAHLKQRLYNYCLRSGSVSTGASIERILTGYNEIIKSNKNYNNKNCQYCKIYNKFAMPRWVLATARFSSKNLDYKEYKELLEKLDYKEKMKLLEDFPEKKIVCAAFALRKFPYLAYLLFRLKGKY